MAKLENNLLIQPFQQATARHYKLLLSADPSRKVVDSYLARAHKFELLNDNQLVGVILLIDTRPETIEIVNVAVIEKYWNHGLGEKLVRFGISWAKEHYYQTIEIGTGSTSFGQLYLYQKCGFRIVGVDTDFFVRNYDEPIIENKLVLKDMVRLRLNLN